MTDALYNVAIDFNAIIGKSGERVFENLFRTMECDCLCTAIKEYLFYYYTIIWCGCVSAKLFILWTFIHFSLSLWQINVVDLKFGWFYERRKLSRVLLVSPFHKPFTNLSRAAVIKKWHGATWLTSDRLSSCRNYRSLSLAATFEDNAPQDQLIDYP